MTERTRALRWLSSLTDKQFAELFHDAVSDRRTSDTIEGRGHFVLADAQREEGRWAVDFIAAPAPTALQWADDLPICQSGICPDCSSHLRSWSKDMLCPVCGASARGT